MGKNITHPYNGILFREAEKCYNIDDCRALDYVEEVSHKRYEYISSFIVNIQKSQINSYRIKKCD